MSAKPRILMTLTVLGLIDIIIPLPIVTLILMYVVIQRPPWFTAMVHDIYGP